MENTKITHSFQYTAHDLPLMFKNTTRFSGKGGWKSKMEAQSILNENKYPRLNYVGDAFEFFVELMFKVIGPTREFGGIHEYQPQEENDNGVDAICKNWDGQQSVVQIKYKRDSERLLTANEDHLSNMVKEATLKYRITPHNPDKKETTKYFVITTGKSLHYYTEDEFFLNSVKCIGWDQLCEILDNNIGFWEKAREEVNKLKVNE
jgi:hypothetical protein